jgi:uncharacterized protein (UPF0276 family)
VAGGFLRAGLWHDSHADPVPDPVFALLDAALERRPGLPVLLERDENWPTATHLAAELDRLAAAVSPAHV